MLTISINTALVAILFCGVVYQNREISGNVQSSLIKADC